MKLPAYPIITLDPYMSIWSKTDNLNDSDTMLWCGIEKSIRGYITIDGEKYMFMGEGSNNKIRQTNYKITPLISQYEFKSDEIAFSVKFWNTFFLDDLNLLSLPCSFAQYSVNSADGKEHSVSVELMVNKNLCYDGQEKEIKVNIKKNDRYETACMGQNQQNPLSSYGDGVSADWGFIYLAAEQVQEGTQEFPIVSVVNLNTSDKKNGSSIFAFDDIYSMEYFGTKLKGYWVEKFKNIENAINYCIKNENILYDRAVEWDKTILNDAADFGTDYQNILTAAFRQVLAAHKLVKSPNGELLYLSKECHSNGCVNTVDVTYPAIPMFLCYNPQLVKAMLTGVFEFSRTPCWIYDFAPHDIGTYPWADGQKYAFWGNEKENYNVHVKDIYKNTDVFNNAYQMPVEECGNMIICAYSYFRLSGDRSQLADNFDLLSKWAEYLKKAGVVLEDQLCTDDFAGRSEKNVNLAIKSVMGIACYSKICEALNSDKSCEYMDIAKEYAHKLTKLSSENDYLVFSIDNSDTWSLKYNMVWDILFDFRLFSDSLYLGESKKYREKMQKYGTPLDYRDNSTKSDWMLWASVLDISGKNTEDFSKCIVKYLADTQCHYCFTDWFCTDKPEEKAMDHRSVQAGLWMPVLKKKLI